MTLGVTEQEAIAAFQRGFASVESGPGDAACATGEPYVTINALAMTPRGEKTDDAVAVCWARWLQEARQYAADVGGSRLVWRVRPHLTTLHDQVQVYSRMVVLPAMVLDDHLHACTREASRVAGSAGARQALTHALKTDPSMAANAEKRLADLTSAVTDKCFIARTEADALRKALNR